jgi:hypothetical protein
MNDIFINVLGVDMSRYVVLTSVLTLFLICCNNVEPDGLGEFNHLFTQANAGIPINCEHLTATKGWSKPKYESQDPHHPKVIEVELHDYMFLTGNDFNSIGVCQVEVEAVRVKMCSKVTDLIKDVNLKNKNKQENMDSSYQLIYGYSLSGASKKYCEQEISTITS